MVELKSDTLMEIETRRVDENGNVRYFCPACSVKYIEYKYLKTHLKECGKIFICQICPHNATFKQKRTYSAHLRSRHNILSIAEVKKEVL